MKTRVKSFLLTLVLLSVHTDEKQQPGLPIRKIHIRGVLFVRILTRTWCTISFPSIIYRFLFKDNIDSSTFYILVLPLLHTY